MNRQFTASNDQETVSEKIRMLIREIEKDAHPGELNELKRAIKKRFHSTAEDIFPHTCSGPFSAPRRDDPLHRDRLPCPP